MKSFLIADDSSFMRLVIKNILVKNGFSVVCEASNGKVAVEKYKELSPDFVTMDITMDEMNGIEALKEIIKYDRNAKVIMVSAMGQESFVKEAIICGAKGFLVKPFTEETVITTITRLC